MTGGAPLVAVIDDDPSVLKGLTRLLNANGYAVLAFASARDFLEQAPRGVGACAVVDMHMPDVSGLELLGHVNLARRDALPAVLISGHCDATLRARARAAGAVVVEKPFLDTELLQAIDAALARGHRELDVASRP